MYWAVLATFFLPFFMCRVHFWCVKLKCKSRSAWSQRAKIPLSPCTPTKKTWIWTLAEDYSVALSLKLMKSLVPLHTGVSAVEVGPHARLVGQTSPRYFWSLALTAFGILKSLSKPRAAVVLRRMPARSWLHQSRWEAPFRPRFGTGILLGQPCTIERRVSFWCNPRRGLQDRGECE